jgi:hypothetical protein
MQRHVLARMRATGSADTNCASMRGIYVAANALHFISPLQALHHYSSMLHLPKVLHHDRNIKKLLNTPFESTSLKDKKLKPTKHHTTNLPITPNHPPT